MMSTRALLQAAQEAEEAGRLQEARRTVERAVGTAQSTPDKFDALLYLARAQSFDGELDAALATYWDARHLAHDGKLSGTAEADLGIGLTLLDLARRSEGIETIRRAARVFRRTGNTLMAGCAEMALAEDLVAHDELDVAERHLEVASDLLRAAGDARLLSSLATLQAEVQVRQGRDSMAETYLCEARSSARRVDSPLAAEELRRRRDAVRMLIQRGRPGSPPLGSA